MNNEVWKGSSQERSCEDVSARHNPFVRPGTRTSGLQVCSFPWDAPCSHAAREEPAAPAASVLSARRRVCHCFHYFYFRALCLLRWLVQAQGILSQRKNFLTGETFIEWIFKESSILSHCRALPLQPVVTLVAISEKSIKTDGERSGLSLMWRGLPQQVAPAEGSRL